MPFSKVAEKCMHAKLLAAAAAAKSLQSCPTLCHPTDGSPPGSPAPEILQARTLEWVAMSFSTVPMRWMKLEPIIQSEVSQKEKHQ